MSDDERRKIRCQAMVDQHWADWRDRLDDIQRVAIFGPDDSEKDRELVRRVMVFMITLLYDQLNRRANPNTGEQQ